MGAKRLYHTMSRQGLGVQHLLREQLWRTGLQSPLFGASGPGVYGYFGGGVGGSCGQYKYIKDGGCADARTDPPGLR